MDSSMAMSDHLYPHDVHARTHRWPHEDTQDHEGYDQGEYESEAIQASNMSDAWTTAFTDENRSRSLSHKPHYHTHALSANGYRNTGYDDDHGYSDDHKDAIVQPHRHTHTFMHTNGMPQGYGEDELAEMGYDDEVEYVDDPEESGDFRAGVDAPVREIHNHIHTHLYYPSNIEDGEQELYDDEEYDERDDEQQYPSQEFEPNSDPSRFGPYYGEEDEDEEGEDLDSTAHRNLGEEFSHADTGRDRLANSWDYTSPNSVRDVNRRKARSAPQTPFVYDEARVHELKVRLTDVKSQLRNTTQKYDKMRKLTEEWKMRLLSDDVLAGAEPEPPTSTQGSSKALAEAIQMIRKSAKENIDRRSAQKVSLLQAELNQTLEDCMKMRQQQEEFDRLLEETNERLAKSEDDKEALLIQIDDMRRLHAEEMQKMRDEQAERTEILQEQIGLMREQLQRQREEDLLRQQRHEDLHVQLLERERIHQPLAASHPPNTQQQEWTLTRAFTLFGVGVGLLAVAAYVTAVHYAPRTIDPYRITY